MPKVSVIVPVYNVEEYIEKSIESLINQTLDDIEIIIVNDGSKDESKKIIEQYLSLYPEKIKYYEKENGGLSDARNYGLKYATGDYIAFLDSDDYVELNMYEEMYQKAIKTDADMVECDFIWEYPQKSRIDNGIKYDENNLKKSLLVNSRVVAWNKLYKKEIIKTAIESDIQFPKGMRYEDVEFFYKIILLLNKVEVVNKPFIHYIQRNTSISNVQNERTREIFTILENVINYYKQLGVYQEYKTELEYIVTRYILCSSLLRVTKIKNKKARKEILNEGYNKLITLFPNWKQNEILKNNKFEKNKKIYMRTVNKFTYKIYAFIFKFK